jgi:hypothetical protein
MAIDIRLVTVGQPQYEWKYEAETWHDIASKLANMQKND